MSAARPAGRSGYGRLRPVPRRQSRYGRQAIRRGYGGVAQPSVSLRRPMNERGQVDLQDNLATKFPSCWRALGAGGLGGTTGCVTRSTDFGGAVLFGLGLIALGSPANAGSVMKMCGEQWRAAKAAETTNGETWPLFLAQCRTQQTGGGAAPAAPTNAPAPAAPPQTHGEARRGCQCSPKRDPRFARKGGPLSWRIGNDRAKSRRCSGQSRPKARGGTIAWSSVRSRSQIACKASAVALSCRFSGRASSQAAW